jgi:GT2 family glycosyltransferase
MSDAPAAVAVAYLHHNQVAYSWHHSMVQVLGATPTRSRVLRGGIIAVRCNAGQIADARNKAIRIFLEGQAPWLWWVDTDMGFAPDTVERLMDAADPVERPVVGALCFAQKETGLDGMGGYRIRPAPTIYDWQPHGDLQGVDIRYDYPPDDLVRCAATGSACILIHRSVLERIAAKHGPVWYDPLPARDGRIGEDLSFCLRAGELDIPVHVHTGISTTHLKPAWLGEMDYRQAVELAG